MMIKEGNVTYRRGGLGSGGEGAELVGGGIDSTHHALVAVNGGAGLATEEPDCYKSIHKRVSHFHLRGMN